MSVLLSIFWHWAQKKQQILKSGNSKDSFWLDWETGKSSKFSLLRSWNINYFMFLTWKVPCEKKWGSFLCGGWQGGCEISLCLHSIQNITFIYNIIEQQSVHRWVSHRTWTVVSWVEVHCLRDSTTPPASHISSVLVSHLQIHKNILIRVSARCWRVIMCRVVRQTLNLEPWGQRQKQPVVLLQNETTSVNSW